MIADRLFKLKLLTNVKSSLGIAKSGLTLRNGDLCSVKCWWFLLILARAEVLIFIGTLDIDSASVIAAFTNANRRARLDFIGHVGARPYIRSELLFVYLKRIAPLWPRNRVFRHLNDLTGVQVGIERQIYRTGWAALCQVFIVASILLLVGWSQLDCPKCFATTDRV